VEKILAYAVTVVPSGKVQIGVPAYGRNATVKVNGVSKVVGTCPTNKPANYLSTLSFTAADAGTAIPTSTYTSPTLNRSAAVRTWDATNAEWQFTYQVRYIGTTSGGKDTSCVVYRTGWYDNAASALARAKLVEKYNLRGIAQWNLDGAAPAQWSSLTSYAATIAPSATKVAVYVASTTTYGTTAKVAVRAMSDGVAVPGAKAVRPQHGLRHRRDVGALRRRPRHQRARHQGGQDRDGRREAEAVDHGPDGQAPGALARRVDDPEHREGRPLRPRVVQLQAPGRGHDVPLPHLRRRHPHRPRHLRPLRHQDQLTGLLSSAKDRSRPSREGSVRNVGRGLETGARRVRARKGQKPPYKGRLCP